MFTKAIIDSGTFCKQLNTEDSRSLEQICTVFQAEVRGRYTYKLGVCSEGHILSRCKA